MLHTQLLQVALEAAYDNHLMSGQIISLGHDQQISLPEEQERDA